MKNSDTSDKCCTHSTEQYRRLGIKLGSVCFLFFFLTFSTVTPILAQLVSAVFLFLVLIFSPQSAPAVPTEDYSPDLQAFIQQAESQINPVWNCNHDDLHDMIFKRLKKNRQTIPQICYATDNPNLPIYLLPAKNLPAVNQLPLRYNLYNKSGLFVRAGPGDTFALLK